MMAMQMICLLPLKIGKMGLENIIQGHGSDIILRGEIDAAVRENVNYLNNIKKWVKAVSKKEKRRRSP